MNRLNQYYFEPRSIPREFERYAGETRQLAVGSPGKLGGLRLEFRRDRSGRTVIGSLWKQVPLQVLRPFYYDEAQPGMAIIYILNPTGGTLQGDRLRLDASLAAGCRVLMTTQAAAKVYRMDSNYATQTINIELGSGSYLEYLPDQTIPYRGSRFYQEINVRMRPGSCFAAWEILTAGRMGRERFEFDVFYSRLSVVDPRDRPLLTDTIVLEPKSSDVRMAGVMGENEVLGNFYLVADRVDEKLVGKVNSTLRAVDALAGVSPLALTGGLLVRVVGQSTRAVRGVLEKVWNDVRMEILGSPAPRLRK